MSSRGFFLTFAAAACIAAAPAFAGSPFDGTYSGNPSTLTSEGGACRPAARATVMVVDGRFRFPAQPDAMVTITDSGRFTAMLERSFAAADKRMQALPRIDGVADGGTLTGEYGTRWCKYAFRLDRVGAR
jgi:hypothetical protein